MSTILVRSGVYRNQPVVNQIFTLVKGFQTGRKGGYVTVKSDGVFGPEFDVVRIRVNGIDSIEYTAGEPVSSNVLEMPKSTKVETDEEVMNRIEQRFNILDDMTKAAINGDIRAMIVQGPPGVGKSYGVEFQL